MIDLTQKALRRRSHELANAACNVADEKARALLLFYSAECGLKAIWMAKNALQKTSSSHSARSATSFVHKLDDILVALRVPTTTIATRPSVLTLQDPPGSVSVGELNQVLRYGGTLTDQAGVMVWLEALVSYVKKELL